MSSIPEQPFNEYEERYFLAEILKNSTLPSTTLLQVIRDAGIEPAWTNIALPTGSYSFPAPTAQADSFEPSAHESLSHVNSEEQMRELTGVCAGRSVAACQHAYQALFQRTPYTEEQKHKRLRRPPSFGEPSPVTERALQPRPISFAPVNGPPQISPATEGDKPRKKRGRPNKEEHDRRVAEAAARGDVYPKPRKPRTLRPSLEGQGVETVEVVGGAASTAVMFTPNKTIYAPPTSPSSSKRKKPLDIITAEGVALPAGQVLPEEQRTMTKIAPRPQTSDSNPSGEVVTATMQSATIPESRDTPMTGSDTASSAGLVPAPGGYVPAQGPPLSPWRPYEPHFQHPLRHEAPLRKTEIHNAPPHEAQTNPQSQAENNPDTSSNVS